MTTLQNKVEQIRVNRADVDATPLRIVEVATKMFIELGYERTTMDELASRAHISKRTLYMSFSGKEDIFTAAVHRMRGLKTSELQTLRVPEGSLASRLEWLALKLTAILTEPGFIAFEKIIAAEARYFPDLAQQHIQTGIKQLVSPVVDALRQKPPFDAMSDRELNQRAHIFVSMAVLPFVREAMFSKDPLDEIDTDSIVVAVGIFLSGNEISASDAWAKARNVADEGDEESDLIPEKKKRGRRKLSFKGLDTKEQILQAATKCFSEKSYDDTGLRDIAGLANVDVALVHRSYGSKEALFVRVLDEACSDGSLQKLTETDELAKAVAQLYAENPPSEKDPLDIIIRSLGSPKANDILVQMVTSQMIEPIASRLKEPADQRASLIMSLLFGLGISKVVMKLPALQNESDDICNMLEAAIQAIIDR